MKLGGTAVCVFLCLAAGTMFAQTRLTFRPVDAAYSSALDRIILINANPNQLHIYDPASNADQTVTLAAVPLSLSVSPNGQYAAVGHDGSISYVNLISRTVARTYPVTMSVRVVALASEWVYGFNPSGIAAVSVRLSTGAIAISEGAPYGLGAAKVHPTIPAVYVATSSILRFDVSSGPVIAVTFVAPNNLGSRLWISSDGSRIIGSGGTIVLPPATPSADATPAGTIPTTFAGIGALADSSVAGRIAVISLPDGSTVADDQIRLYASNGLQETGRLRLSPYLVGTNKFAAHGRWVFFNNAGTAVYAVSQADGAAGLLNDFAVQNYALSNLLPCFASFSPSTITVPSSGSLITTQVTADETCVFQASTATSWLQVVAGGFGSGNGPMTIHARVNTSSSPRTGTVAIGTQVLTVTQDGAPSVPGFLNRLSYKVADAEYSKALDRMVLVSSEPNELHVVDGVTRADQFVALAYPAQVVSVRPDGLYAAVGHKGFISYVNLQTLTVEKRFNVIGEIADIALAGNGYLYYVEASGELLSVQISTGTLTNAQTMVGKVLRLQPPGDYLYANGYGYNIAKFDVRQGPPTAVTIPSAASCYGFWIYSDGARLFNMCGDVYRTSDIPQQDLAPNGTFGAAASRIAAGEQASTQAVTAVIAEQNGSTLGTSEVQLYADDGLTLLGRLMLTKYADATAVRNVLGRYLFWNRAADRLFAISQVDGAAGLLSDFVIESISPATIRGCTVTLASTSADVKAPTSTVTIAVNAGNNCAWSVSRTDYWISLPSYPSVTGAGPGSFQVTVATNLDSTSRTGYVSVGGSTFTIRQAAPSSLSLYAPLTSYPASGGTSYLSVSTTSAATAWTATTDVPWILLIGGSGTGSKSFNYSVAVNTGAARTGTITVGSESVTITQAASVQAPGAGLRFVPVTPCRVADSRGGGFTGAFGTPFLGAGAQRDYPIPQSACGILPTAAAYSLNVTVVPKGPLAYLTIWPTGNARPFVSTLNSFDGRVKANAAVVPAGVNGSVSVFVTDATDVILDINGYFVPPTANNLTSSYLYSNVNPCRIVDTRLSARVNGGPSMTAGQTRTFSPRGGVCGSFFDAAAYSLNITAIPKSGALAYLTVWPAGGPRPLVSTLNSFTGTIVANAAIVPVGANGDISVFVTNEADIVIDINGYFPLSSSSGSRYYALTPCRISDTRNASGTFGGPVQSAGQARSYPPTTAGCSIPAAATAYVLNATVVPGAPLSFLTIWPTGMTQPLVSTLNAFDGSITSNALIVPAGAGGAISAYTTDATHLILDTSGYFAP